MEKKQLPASELSVRMLIGLFIFAPLFFSSISLSIPTPIWWQKCQILVCAGPFYNFHVWFLYLLLCFGWVCDCVSAFWSELIII